MWFFTALIAKIASAGAVAQAATGAGIVLVSFTGLGAAHALPAPVQHTFSTVVSAISPAGDGGTSTGTGTTGSATTSDTAATTTASTDAATPANAATGTTAPKNFGETVSKDARDGGVDGRTISQLAHDRNAARKSGETRAQTPETDASDTAASETDAPETDAPETDAPETEAPETDGSQDGSNGGHGNSAHSGHGGH